MKGVKAAADEYDLYLPEIVRMLDAQASVAELAAHLDKLQSHEMGVVPVKERSRAAAEQLAALRARWRKSD